MSKKLRYLNSFGDTVVEVLICLAILGTAFSISYATAHNSILSTRNSQEHSEALQVLNSQVELIRANVNQQQQSSPVFGYTTNAFCIDPSTDQPIDAANHTCSVFGSEGFYKVSITYSQAPNINNVNQDIFSLTATWPGIGQLGQQQVQLNYKIHPNDSL